MKVFLAGATGVLGRELIPRLVARGHVVVGMTRVDAKRALLESLGARPVVADALDADAVRRAVEEAAPEVVVHQLTAIPAAIDLRAADASLASTNRLRTEGTDNLLAAAIAAGARRVVAQSYAAFLDRSGPRVQNETAPQDTSPPDALRATVAALRHLEHVVTHAEGLEGLVLRYGVFYGPGTSLGVRPDGEMAAAIRAGRLPLVGGGTGVWSFVHVADAAAATALAVERGEPGIYHVTDDEPAPVAEWLPAAAAALGMGPPRRIPAWIARVAAGEVAVTQMTAARGASNQRARTALGWQPSYPSWRDGFPTALGVR